MLKMRLKRSVLALLALSAALSCAPGDDRRDSPLAPEAATPTSFDESSLLGLTGTTSSSEYTLIEERLPVDLPTLQVSSVIGLLGGQVNLAGHRITVPAGAVALPTVFTLTLLTNGYVEVEITALQTNLLGQILDVGEQGFRKPVTLTLTYARGTNVTDPARLRIMRWNANGRHEILPTNTDVNGKVVTAQLDHFSRYCMIAN